MDKAISMTLDELGVEHDFSGIDIAHYRRILP